MCKFIHHLYEAMLLPAFPLRVLASYFELLIELVSLFFELIELFPKLVQGIVLFL